MTPKRVDTNRKITIRYCSR